MLIIDVFAGFKVRSHTDRPIALRSKMAQAAVAGDCPAATVGVTRSHRRR